MKKSFYFKQKSILAWIVYNILRIIPIVLFSWLFFIYYFILYLIDNKTYSEKLEKWQEACKDETSLKNFFLVCYKYKYDLVKGFVDHDSSKFEWIFSYGDCDDAAKYAKKAMRKLGYESYRIGILWFPKKKFPKLHFDCLTVIRDENGNIKEAKLFNYGYEIVSTTVDEALYTLTGRYTEDRKTKTKVCISIC